MSLLRSGYRFSLILLEALFDTLGLALSFVLAHLVYAHLIVNEAALPIIEKLEHYIFVGLITLFVFFLHNLYRKQKSILNIEETRLILKSLIISTLVTFTLAELLRERRHPLIDEINPLLSHIHTTLSSWDFSNKFSRIEILLSFGFMFPILSVLRYGLFKFQQSLHLKGVGNERVLIYGSGDLARRLRDKIKQSPKSGYYLIGHIRNRETPLENVPELGLFEDLEAICDKWDVDRILVADAAITPERMVEILRFSQNSRIDLEFVPALHSLFVHRIELNDVDGLPLITVRDITTSLVHRMGKRVFDLMGSICLLLASSPLFLLIMAWVKLGSRGPIFFKQERVGLNGRSFTMIKFRTMHVDSEAYATTPGSSEDPRITTSGRFLRRFSLDELPQLINVLLGTMSLVGPRPEMPFIADKYGPQEKERLLVKPGITGLWQISGDRRLQIHENLDYDLYYIEHQSLLLDMVILLRTFFSVIRGIGAY